MKHISNALYNSPWLITPEKLSEIEAVVRAKIETGSGLDFEARSGRSDDRDSGYKLIDGVAVIPIHGAITARPTLFSTYSGGTSCADIQSALYEAIDDGKVESILLDIDSPGGEVIGIPEVGAAIASANKKKPIHAHANYMAASAAYWLGSQANSFSVAPSGQVGSVGVVMMHREQSQRDIKEGLTTTVIRSGSHKAELNPYEKLSVEAREYLQSISDQIYGDFLEAVSIGRGVSIETVEREFGQGRVKFAKEALKSKMVDRIETFDSLLGQLTGKSKTRRERSMSAELVAMGLPTR